VAEHDIRLGDCLAGMREIEAGSVALLLTDVPYAVSKNGGDIVRNGGSVLVQDFFECDRDAEAINEVVRSAVRLALQKLKATGAAYVYCGHSQFGFIEQEMKQAGCDRTGFLVWCKTSPAPSVRKAGWVSSAELCVWGRRPGNRFHFTEHSEMLNVFRCASMRHGSIGKTEHPTQKPLEVIEPIVRAQSDVGDLVLDPFAGSGTTLVACKRLGRRGLGWEREAKFHADAVKRLEGTRQQYEFAPRPAKPKQARLLP
jgi:DNA modification methylase